VKSKIIIAIQFALIILVSLFLFFQFSGKKELTSITLFGNIDIRQVDLGFRVSGKVQSVMVEEGDVIQKGDLLAKLDPIPYEEGLSVAIADLKQKQVNFQNACAKFQRRDEVNENAIAAEEVEDAYFEKLSLEAEVELAKAKLAQALTSLDDTTLIAPSSGVLLTRIKEPGSILAQGEPVLSLALNDPVWVRAYINEPDLGAIYPGMAAQIFLDTPGSKVYQGTIGFISPIAEFTPKTVETLNLRTDLVYRLRIIIQNPDRFLRQGMPVTVKLMRQPPETSK
jgi:HlyD family secretion protein